MTTIRTLLAFLAIALSFPVAAGPSAEAAKTCLSDSTTGKERKALARWIFLAMAAHPDMRTLSRATLDDSDQASRAVGLLVTRLISETCASEIKAMVRSEGPESLRHAFEFLGILAMQELTANPDVKASISSFERFVDRSKISAVLDSK